MKNPLHKRLPREIRSEFGKYIVIFLLMVATIGFVSGFLVADNSMLLAYQDGFEKYNIEDGNFRTADRIYRSQREDIEKLGITLYENYYIEATLDNESTMRFFKNREEINKVCLMDGELPAKTGEIAIDRMYADNSGLSVGDILQSGKKTWKITGLVALSDYSCLFQNNNDSMFGRLHQTFQSCTCCIEVTLKEHHLCWRSGGTNKEIQLILLFCLNILNFRHTFVHILL